MFLVISAVALLFRIFLIMRDSFPFAYDMGRDLLWVKDIAFYQTPTLIGPAASIWGVYFGPFWYYFLALPLLISGGNPVSAVYATAVSVVLSGTLAFIFFKHHLGKFFAFILSVIILFNSNLINISTFAFHANLLPLLTILMINFCFLSVIKNPLYLALAFLTVGLMFSADPAPAVVFSFVPAIVFFYFKLYKSAKIIRIFLFSFFAYAIPFIPQIIFELRNNFIQSRSLISYFLGSNPSLSGQLPFFERIANRLELFLDFFSSNFTGSNKTVAVLLFFAVAAGIYKFSKTNIDRKIKILFKINLFCFLTSFLIFTFPFTVEVKNWYLFGLGIPVAFLITFSLYAIRHNKFLIYTFLIFYLVVNLFHFFSFGKKYLWYKDPAQFVNQTTAVNLIYADVSNEDFSVYVFTPPIYDLNYQYLFWWQGEKLKKGLPSDFAYLPNQPSYVRNKQNYQNNPKISENIYLIIENSPENIAYSKNEWFKKFKDYKIVWEKNVNGAITIQKRKS